MPMMDFVQWQLHPPNASIGHVIIESFDGEEARVSFGYRLRPATEAIGELLCESVGTRVRVECRRSDDNCWVVDKVERRHVVGSWAEFPDEYDLFELLHPSQTSVFVLGERELYELIRAGWCEGSDMLDPRELNRPFDISSEAIREMLTVVLRGVEENSEIHTGASRLLAFISSTDGRLCVEPLN